MLKPRLEPTGFLSLPRELRQDILLRTTHNYHLIKIGPGGCFWYSYEHLHNPIKQWVKVLREAFSAITDDVGYLEERWVLELDAIWKAGTNLDFVKYIKTKGGYIEYGNAVKLAEKTGNYGFLRWFETYQ